MTPEKKKMVRKQVFVDMIVCFLFSIIAANVFVIALDEINNNPNAYTDASTTEFIVLLIIMIVLFKNLKL